MSTTTSSAALHSSAARPMARLAGHLRAARGPVPWSAVTALAAVMSYADGFWSVTALGAVGAIERQQHPFLTWLVGSTALLPLFVLAVLAGLGLARRQLGRVLTSFRQVTGAALLVALTGGVLGSAVVIASAMYDWQLQQTLVTALASTHHQSPTALQDTWALDVRAARVTSLLLIGTNVVLVAWVLALSGGRLDAVGRPTRQPGS